MRPGQIEPRTHDYRRHGTTSFATLDVKTSDVVGQLHRPHRSIEFRKFLDTTRRRFRRWFAKRPRFHVYFLARAAHALECNRRGLSALGVKASRPATRSFVAQVIEIQLVDQALDGDLELRHLMPDLDTVGHRRRVRHRGA
jgi:hypothetical protein